MEVIKKKICIEDFISRTPIPTSNLPVVPQSVQSVGGSGLESVSTDDLVGML